MSDVLDCVICGGAVFLFAPVDVHYLLCECCGDLTGEVVCHPCWLVGVEVGIVRDLRVTDGP